MTYAYASYSLFDGTPLVRIHRTVAGELPGEPAAAEYKLDWSQWLSSVDVNVGPDLWVTVRPYQASRQHSGMRAGVVGWGQIEARAIRGDASEPVDMMREDVVRGLKSLETMEALAWLVRAVDDE